MEITDKNIKDINILLFILYFLSDAEIRYYIREREILRIFRALVKYRHILLEFIYLIIIYINYKDLLKILNIKRDLTSRIIY